MKRTCDWCHGPISRASRRDAKTCSKRCRQAKSRFRVGVAPIPSSTPTLMRFAYADPPYPGLSKRYYQSPEVNHRVLIGTLERDYPDGWALSTSAEALRAVLLLCPEHVRVSAWLRGSRGSVAYRARSAWEPVIVCRGRARRLEGDDQLDDALVWGGRQHTHPGALTGMKPAAFCEWVFQQLGATAGDSLDDIFPGSGAVTRAWNLYQGEATAVAAPSRLSEAQARFSEAVEEYSGDTSSRSRRGSLEQPTDESRKAREQ